MTYPQYGPDNVDVTQCHDNDESPEHFCIHDWRIHWGNVDRRQFR
ncbi:hypothetical protein SEA_TNGUYEN7_18 [Mycobacterium phage TNguyen7]|uniref:Head-to-tail connector protein n=3 Tax=Veracruzvirus heldan TaxID=1032892 RepID=A0A8F3E232_9CAUD|nr:hypothetical protein FGG19_gp79 [Mycobacterium phage HelDan]AVR57003.1 hypothetical protein PBI_PUPPY_19 [Mycobacterium phage Puppy]AVR77429.1 hypothetical protein SEA_TNGUYEN7_18 [Mycobacterium phage TNguyen7]QDP44298.1 hypothetical protein SEA_HEATHEN_18 [Mycobacterium phage Heathen]QWY79559.1 hypothetical protein SEA_SCOUT_18 [Mycobacterium phage Scout]AEJ92012.1 hypothetical protein HELDAN_18 [Mycobacterium phage HelDan]